MSPDRIRPQKLAHFVLRTSRYRTMVEWYQRLLEADVLHSDAQATFMSYDDEHHRVAIVNMPGLLPGIRATAGVDHVAFTYGSLDELLATYERLAKDGVKPVWPINHGATTSLYYEDPDANYVELQIDNFPSRAALDEFLSDGRFRVNPIGIDFDPEELVARRKAGVPVEELVRWPDEVAPRTTPLPRPYLGRLHATLLGLRARLKGR
jgi:catechol 2,3-dioxygenase-like lactoylglutathione lyase family enzyme